MESPKISNAWEFINRQYSITIDYKCGYCEREVSSEKGMFANGSNMFAMICPSCGCVSMIENEEGGYQMPGSAYGRKIKNLPEIVSYLYKEARDCYKIQAYTAVILISRKALANVAIYFGAEDGNKFTYYVNFLVEEGYIPKRNKKVIDKIRTEGNSATHNKTSKNSKDAKDILNLLEMLLLINFEYNDEHQDSNDQTPD
jgi:hypothetical protein|nr:MAG TPA: protein of unknown function (DUF4145) [Caudoviricetes sp.]